MKLNKIIGISTVILTVALAGCQQINQKRATYVRDRALDYRTSGLIAPLRIPEDLS